LEGLFADYWGRFQLWGRMYLKRRLLQTRGREQLVQGMWAEPWIDWWMLEWPALGSLLESTAWMRALGMGTGRGEKNSTNRLFAKEDILWSLPWRRHIAGCNNNPRLEAASLKNKSKGHLLFALTNLVIWEADASVPLSWPIGMMQRRGLGDVASTGMVVVTTSWGNTGQYPLESRQEHWEGPSTTRAMAAAMGELGEGRY